MEVLIGRVVYGMDAWELATILHSQGIGGYGCAAQLLSGGCLLVGGLSGDALAYPCSFEKIMEVSLALRCILIYLCNPPAGSTPVMQ
ncbi:hypothetical protein An12g05940 [Aspergillus niger]|uniref:Uncharacterized protein n=2 Tax=Aspergillus niger TaxID=5061 RepID=A2QZR9_ASPNC|nr:hypothetical protein An12g05940 [Aspergillus niger]CAK46301.1 hypothetical protein An12g05940 [Aspergillus niger]